MVRREIAYIVPHENSSEEFCIRNICYNNPREFRKDVVQTVPVRIDIGAHFDGDVTGNKDKVKDLCI